MTRYLLPLLACALLHVAAPAASAACAPTGYAGLTAALVNPGDLSGTVDATGCDIGVYYSSGSQTVAGAEVFGALRYGIFVNGDASDVEVDVRDSRVYDIGDTPFNGNQRGVAIYYRAFLTGTASGRISGNTVEQYQKGGIVANGAGTTVQVRNNTVKGFGPVGFIAQNGIQIGYGAKAIVMRNVVSGHSYTGATWASGGILVVGGPGYGGDFTVGTQIVNNTLTGNDIGVYLSQYEADFAPPASPTHVWVVNNRLVNDGCNNAYQAGVSDVGNRDKILANRISGAGYETCGVEVDDSYAIDPLTLANR